MLLLALVALGTSATPAAAQDPVHVEIREFTIGGYHMAGALPAPLAQMPQTGRCDLQCEVPTQGLRLVVVDVRGPDGSTFQFQYERTGCWWFTTPAAEEMRAGQPEGPRNATGRKIVDVQGCTSLVVRPAVVDVWSDPWKCTHNPPFIRSTTFTYPEDLPWNKPIPRHLTVPVADPTAEGGAEYVRFAECLQTQCVGGFDPLALAHPCLPDYHAQATGTVRLEW